MPRFALRCCATIFWIVSISTASAVEPIAADEFESTIRPVLMETCGGCHDPDDEDNHVRFLDATKADEIGQARSLWSNAAEQLRNRTMPPADSDQPREADRLRVANWIDNYLTATACDGGEQPLPVTTRRLNRTEYDNTIRDLVGLDLSLSEKFPADGSGGEGFDNNGETLFLPPLLMERYLEAAETILNSAIVTPVTESFAKAPALIPKGDAEASVRPILRGQKLSHPFIVYCAGNYTIRAKFPKEQAVSDGSKVALLIDGVVASRFDLSKLKSEKEWLVAPATVRLTRGLHLVSVKNTTPLSVEDDNPINVYSLQHWERPEKVTDVRKAAHKRILGVDVGQTPATAIEREEQAQLAVSRFMRKAFRRTPSRDEIARSMSLYQRAEERGDPWEECIKLALKSVLVSPKFLFRIEQAVSKPAIEPLSDFELATRLSYFLWASMPDAELLNLAEAGELSKPVILEQQVDRLLNSPKSKTMSREFVGQWLGTRDVAGRVAPDTSAFKGQFSTELLLDMRQEPVEMFDFVVRNNRPIVDLIDPSYAVLNARLAQHYGLMGKKGEKVEYGWPWSASPKKGSGGPFREVPLADKQRGGVLGMAGVHLLTSYPTRTSVVLRGGWVLETLLGVRVPAPPPDVPELKKPKKGQRSEREILAAHREAATCAACHNLMDPVGFALDNFDVLGRWREQSYGFDVDASGVLPSGEEFRGPAGLKAVLLNKKDQFMRHLTEKMLGYAVGRSLEDADDCTISEIVETVEQNGGTARALVKGVAMSVAFRFKSAPTDSVLAANSHTDFEDEAEEAPTLADTDRKDTE